MAIAAGLMTKPRLAIFDSLCMFLSFSKVLLKLNFLFYFFFYAFTQSDKCVVSLFSLSVAEGSRILVT